MSQLERDPEELDWQEALALERRRSTEQALWTLPGASLAAQAFLYTRGFDPTTSGLARLLVAIVGLVTAIATILIVGEQAYRMEVFRQFVHASRRERGVGSISRNAMVSKIQRINGKEHDSLRRYAEGPFRVITNGRLPVGIWLGVMVVFAGIDLFTVVAAVLQILGVWNPFGLTSS